MSMSYSEQDYRRDAAYRERERAREGRIVTVALSEADLRALLTAIDSPSCTDTRLASLYHRLRHALVG